MEFGARLLSLLREALGAARASQGWPKGAKLDQHAIANLRTSPAPKRNDLLFRSSKNAEVKINTASPAWQAAANAPPQRRPLLHLAAAAIAELRRPDIDLAGDLEVALVCQELAVLALGDDRG